MKKYLFLPLAIIVVTLISWGGVGHKTVATIAENHLTPKSKEMVKVLLGNESLSDVASWADEVLRQPEYKSTALEHYANVSLGLNYQAFSDNIKNQPQDNVYKALLKNEEVLKAQSSTKEQKIAALKFIVHFVGDLHQPMHVSRAEDKGGNTIQVQFDGQGTNLHSLWDSKLIGKEGKSFEQMSIDYDKATPKQVKQWQSEDMMKWLFESYQISSKIYTEVEQNNKLDDSYYKKYIPVVQQRIQMAGIRLAGLLNNVFKDQSFEDVKGTFESHGSLILNSATNSSKSFANINIEDAAKYIGESVSITAKVYSCKELANMTLVNLGAEYPNQLLTVVLRGDAKALSKQINNTVLSVKGKLELYKEKPQITVNDTQQIQISSQ